MYELLLLILGLVALVLGTELVVKGAVNIAEKYKVSHIFIGLTILAIGTDLPEFLIAINGSVNQLLHGTDASGLIVGDALGSCFSQIMFVLGIAGLMSYFVLTDKQIKIDGTIMLGSVALFFVLAIDGKVTRVEGIVLLLVYLIYYSSLYRAEKVAEKIKKAPSISFAVNIAALILGLGVVVFSSDVVVNNALLLAKEWGVKQSIIGIFIAGLGTGLPELAVAFGSIFRGAKGLSIGNLVGSNIFDMLVPTGAAAVIAGLNVSHDMIWFDIPVLFAFSALVLGFFMRKKGLQKKEAAILIICYLAYTFIRISGYLI